MRAPPSDLINIGAQGFSLGILGGWAGGGEGDNSVHNRDFTQISLKQHGKHFMTHFTEKETKTSTTRWFT